MQFLRDPFLLVAFGMKIRVNVVLRIYIKLIHLKKYIMLFDYSAVSLTLYSYYILHHPLNEMQIKVQPSVYSVRNVMLFTSSCCGLILESSKCFQWCREHLTPWSSQTFQYEMLFFCDIFLVAMLARGSLSSQCICCLCDWFWAVDLHGKLFR